VQFADWSKRMNKSRPRNLAITGASAGIGRALALAYARRGVTLGLVGRNPERLEHCAQACRAKGAHVLTASLDVRDATAIRNWLNEFDSTHPIDLLIANAGVASTLTHANDWEGQERTANIVDTNFYGALNTALPIIERMRSRRRGHVALISSIAALRGMAISPAYCASKAALKAWGDSVRPVLARDNIRVSIVLPGFVKTAMSDVFPGDKPIMWSAEKAASHIQSKLAAGRAEIAFPGLLAFGMRLLALLPAALADAILDRMSYLPREER
jgi:short-subunit dehydrogenase